MRVVALLLFVAGLLTGGFIASNVKTSVNVFAKRQDSNPAVPFTNEDITLHIKNSQIKVNGELIVDGKGSEAAGYVIHFYSPKYGRFIFSTRPHPKYEFEQVEVIGNHRIVFSSCTKQFDWSLSAPLVRDGAISHLWMMHDRHPEPLKDKKPGGGEIGASSHYEYLLPNS